MHQLDKISQSHCPKHIHLAHSVNQLHNIFDLTMGGSLHQEDYVE